jgi:hypothetical protein
VVQKCKPHHSGGSRRGWGHNQNNKANQPFWSQILIVINIEEEASQKAWPTPETQKNLQFGVSQISNFPMISSYISAKKMRGTDPNTFKSAVSLSRWYNIFKMSIDVLVFSKI